MPTELMTLAAQRSAPDAPAGRASPLRGMKSVQIATQRHDDLSFGDVLDMLNPLHHIPVVSSLYQNATGDTISPVAKLVGGGLLGGVFGFIGAAFNAIFEEATGQGVLGSIAAAVQGEAPEKHAPQAVAAAGGDGSRIRQAATQAYTFPAQAELRAAAAATPRLDLSL